MNVGEDSASLPGSGPWAARLGIEPLPGEAGLSMRIGPEHLNFLDGAHGGALFSLAEAALRGAAGDGAEATLVEAHLALTAGGGEGEVLTALVHPVKTGRTLGVYRVAVTRTDGRLVGEFTGTVRFGP
ncbi:MAG: PaaI family thioesterase [Actinomycetota bacterium]